MDIKATLFAAALLLIGCDQNQTSTKGQRAGTSGPLTPEIIHSDPSLSGPVLKRPQISPDGSMVTVLQGREDDAFQQDLWAYDLATGQGRVLVSSTDLLGAPETLSEEEKNRRERAREYGKGIVSYSFSKDGTQLLFPLGGDVYVYDLPSKTAKQVTKTDGYETDARLTVSGKFVTYVRDNELFVKNLKTGIETQLSSGATKTIRNGIASFVVQEELARSTGYWPSPDETRIAYTQIDESPIKIEHRIEFSADGIANIAQRYPFAGTDNAQVKLGVVPMQGGVTRWVDIGDNPDIYLARVYWSKDGSILYAGILSRDHKSLKMLAINPDTGENTLIFEETSPTWINVRGDFKALQGGGFLWTSERSGFRHIYRFDKDGTAHQITKGNWPVKTVNCVDEKGGKIYFTGWQNAAIYQHIFVVGFDGTGLKRLSDKDGWNSAQFSRNCAAYIGTYSNKAQPPQTRAYDNTGKPLIWLNENALADSHPYAPYMASHIKPQFGQLNAEDGTKLDYMLYKPKEIKPGERRPVVTIVYGGPGVQRVADRWDSKLLLHQLLVDSGFIVFQLDNRGATGRGKKFEDYLYRSMGRAEVVDQTRGAEFLKNLSFIDPDRMGVYGWSYGGYMTLHMLAQTNLYKVGVSGAPVTDWKLYDTAYTERYLGDPRPDNPNYTKGAYEGASVFTYLDGLTEPFLLLHGMADDNVVFRHSVKLMGDMQNRGQQNMHIMTYPGEKHGFRGHANKVHRDTQIVEFFKQHLLEK
ncbi:MAG TPA: S9 family peptidase [Hellea balneolensis]|uniref:S9 family peptidase n=1 Tax=Hellea balneolensis TaxID=287478 RepID=A0A7C5LTS2_9PROT|nr:S9 family peptidase [Hellea balneolensis]